MFLINHLITEAGFDNFDFNKGGQDQQDPQDSGDLEQPAIEFANIKKYILYQKIKQIQHLLKGIQFSNSKVDPQFYSLLEFCQTIIDFFNSFAYPDAVRMIDNLVDGIEEVLKLKIPKRIPFEPPMEMNNPIDDFNDTKEMLGPQQSPQQPITPQVPGSKGVKNSMGTG